MISTSVPLLSVGIHRVVFFFYYYIYPLSAAWIYLIEPTSTASILQACGTEISKIIPAAS